MAEDVVIEFSADTKELQSTIDLLEKLGQVDKKTADEFRKATEEYNKRQLSQKGLQSEFDKTGKAAQESGKAISKSLKESSSSVSDFRKSLLEVGRAIGIAFGVAEIINFGKESVKAFGEAELNAKKLQTAVGVNGGLQKDFNTLIAQSKELEGITIFSDDDIQRLQTAALQFGLTTDQVRALTPVITDFASATGQDLQSALQGVIAGINGNGRSLRQYGVTVDDTKSKAEKFASIQDQLTKKFEGQAKQVGETSAGAVAKLGNAFDDLKEKVGEFLSVEAGLTDFFKGLTRLFSSEFDLKIQFNKNATDQARGEALKQVEETRKILEAQGRDGSSAAKVVLDQFNKQIVELHKQLNQAKTTEEKSYFTRQILLAKASADAIRDINNKSAKDNINYAKLSIAELQKLAGQNNVFAQDELDRRNDQRKKDQENQNKANDAKIKAQEELNKVLADLNEQAATDDFEAKKIALKNNFEAIKDELAKIVEVNPALAEQSAKALALALKVLNQETAKVSQEAFKDAVAANEQILNDGLDNIKDFFDKQAELKSKIKDDPTTVIDEAARAEADIIDIKKKSIDTQIGFLGMLSAAGIETGKDFLANIKKLEGDRTVLAQEEADKRKEIEKKEQQAKIDEIFKVVDKIKDISGALIDLGSGLSEARIQSIERERDAQIAAADEELTILQGKRDKELISQAAFENQKKALLKQREQAEITTQKKINEEKHKTDIANKAQKLFEITIATAKAIAEASPNPLLIALAATLGAAQLAAVIATPLPKYHKGQRAQASHGEQLAIVRKDEDIFSPEKSREYRPTFRAIHDGRIKPLDLNNFVSWKLKGTKEAPALTTVINKLDIDYEKLAYEMAWQMQGNRRVKVDNIKDLAAAINSNYDPRRS